MTYPVTFPGKWDFPGNVTYLLTYLWYSVLYFCPISRIRIETRFSLVYVPFGSVDITFVILKGNSRFVPPILGRHGVHERRLRLEAVQGLEAVVNRRRSRRGHVGNNL